jgi:hypothetical protein
MKKKNKFFKIFGITLLVLILIASFVYFGFLQQSMITIRTYEKVGNLPIETGIFNFAGIQGTYETIKLGCYSGGHVWILNGGDDNDEVSFCNSLDSSNNILKLSSSLSTGGHAVSNYIENKITLPAGKVSVKYDYILTEYYLNSVVLDLKIYDKNLHLYNPAGAPRGRTITGNGIYEFELNESTEVVFRITPTVNSRGENSVGNIEVTFIPNPIIVDEPVVDNDDELIIDNDDTPIETSKFSKFINSILNWFKNLFGGF